MWAVGAVQGQPGGEDRMYVNLLVRRGAREGGIVYVNLLVRGGAGGIVCVNLLVGGGAEGMLGFSLVNMVEYV